MEREKFMQEARLTAHRILEGKENAIMNIVQQAWAEGKRNAEVETLRAAIDEALDRRETTITMSPATGSCVEPVYPTWAEWLYEQGVLKDQVIPMPTMDDDSSCVVAKNVATEKLDQQIPADIAVKLRIEPKEASK